AARHSRGGLSGRSDVHPPATQINAFVFLSWGTRLFWDYHQVVKVGDGIFICHRDITERKRAEQEVKHSQALSKAIMDSISGAFYMIDASGKYVGWNAYQRDEIVGQPETLMGDVYAIDTIHPDDRQLVGARIANVLKNGAEEVVEGRVLLRGGPDFRWFLMTGWRVTINGDPVLIGIGTDITERKRLEAQLAQSQKMESVGRLAGGVAHDFNNMLGVILGHTDLAAAQVDKASPLHADLAEIRHAAERSADLTRQLLAFARRQTIAPRVMDLNETVEGMLKMLRRLIGENLELVWRPAAVLSPVKLDPSQIGQVLANLCVNARDAIDGVGTITIETGEATFDEAYCATHADFTPGRYVRLTVSDNGCGMDAETQTHLFEPFFTTKGVGQGTGLGLATVYGIVKQNGGFIHICSELGHGTTVSVDLPSYAGGTEPCQAGGVAGPANHGQETILLVEDEPALLTLGARMLEQLGYRVLAAGTPGDALRLAEGHAGEIHLLLTDVVMPEM
ncbi:MAG: ATP-binding protein, partial [Desulfobacterales bacterium]|nr:ATP-binding protein [Desulfobacterales bacterium]